MMGWATKSIGQASMEAQKENAECFMRYGVKDIFQLNKFFAPANTTSQKV